MDDADQLDAGLAVTMIETLAGRYDGRVLMVGEVRPGPQRRSRTSNRPVRVQPEPLQPLRFFTAALLD
jgi:hypothetical protein